MHITRAVVTERFRSELAMLVPSLGTNERYWRFASYCLFPSMYDQSKRRALLPQRAIFELLGRKAGQSSFDRVAEFSANVWHIELSGWRWGWSTEDDECRHIQAQRFPQGVESLVKAELRGPKGGRLVYLDDGSTYNARNAKAERDKVQAKADKYTSEAARAKGIELLQNNGCQEAFDLLNYLNNLAPNRFTRILEHMPEAREAAKTHRDANNQLTLLNLIATQSKPFYRPSNRSCRIFSLNASLLRLAKPVRDVLTKDWISADLQSCQLAVCAAKWGDGIPSVITYLKARENDPTAPSIWHELCQHMGLEFNDDHKAIMKEALYSLIFGRSTQKFRAFFLDELPGVKNAYKRFVSHYLIADMLSARKTEFTRLKQAKYGIDAFGNRVYPALDDNGKENWRSVLAIIAQSYELAILYPVVQLAEQNNEKDGFTITYWLHDGIGIDVHKDSKESAWMKKIKNAVDMRAKELGIPTTLIFS